MAKIKTVSPGPKSGPKKTATIDLTQLGSGSNARQPSSPTGAGMPSGSSDNDEAMEQTQALPAWKCQ